MVALSLAMRVTPTGWVWWAIWGLPFALVLLVSEAENCYQEPVVLTVSIHEADTSWYMGVQYEQSHCAKLV